MFYLFTGNISSPGQINIANCGSFENIDTTFISFVDDMFDILSGIEFSKVQRRCLDNLNITGGISLPDIETKIDDSENLHDLFKTLSSHIGIG